MIHTYYIFFFGLFFLYKLEYLKYSGLNKNMVKNSIKEKKEYNPSIRNNILP